MQTGAVHIPYTDQVTKYVCKSQKFSNIWLQNIIYNVPQFYYFEFPKQNLHPRSAQLRTHVYGDRAVVMFSHAKRYTVNTCMHSVTNSLEYTGAILEYHLLIS